MTRSALWVVLAVSLALAVTAAFFGWERAYEGPLVALNEGSINLDTGEYYPPPRHWERAVGVAPHAFYQGWGSSPDAVRRWELVRYDYPRLGLAALAFGLS